MGTVPYLGKRVSPIPRVRCQCFEQKVNKMSVEFSGMDVDMDDGMEVDQVESGNLVLFLPVFVDEQLLVSLLSLPFNLEMCRFDRIS